jgi:hypothetical protein
MPLTLCLFLVFEGNLTYKSHKVLLSLYLFAYVIFFRAIINLLLATNFPYIDQRRNASASSLTIKWDGVQALTLDVRTRPTTFCPVILHTEILFYLIF